MTTVQPDSQSGAAAAIGPFLVPMLKRRQKVRYLLGIALWIDAIGSFWSWWL